MVGAMAAIQPGESVRLDGVWSTHPQYGRQFKFTRYTLVYPATVEGVRKYLGSGLIKGIGPVTAKRIVEHFQLDTLEVIDQAPDRLLEVPGIGPKRVAIIKKGWETQKQIKDVMIFLQSHGVSTGYSVRIYKEYGTKAISLVRANPYRLEQDIFGVGFLTADRIAQRLGIGEAAPARLKAGLRYVLNQASEQGHVFLPRDELLQAAQQELTVDGSLILPQITELAREEGVVVEGDRVYLPVLYHAESGVASSLCRLLRDPPPPVTWDVPAAIKALGRGQGIQYDETQIQALRMAVQSKVMVLTGGPGTGKTTITRGIIGLLQQQHLGVLLCSPTGRAAKKLSEATGREAKTIHRLLEVDPRKGGFQRNGSRPLETQVLIVDECSMVDVPLMQHLLRAIPPTGHLILVGDTDQLPSVGPGSVLRDLIESEVAPVVRLTEIFRQAAGSQIIANAHLVNQGILPAFNKDKTDSDFFLVDREEPEKIIQTLIHLVKDRIPQRFGLNALRDIQVLCPMNRGSLGTRSLNVDLQEALNPQRPEQASVERFGWQFRPRDKVIQTVNNYDKDVFNGDIGQVVNIDPTEQVVEIRFDDRIVPYDYGELDELSLAYAITIHKSQGSEFPAVVIPVSTQQFVMLQRNLIYTGMTRGRKLVVMVGQPKAMAMAVKNIRYEERFSGLLENLRH